MNVLFVTHYDKLYGSIRSLMSLIDGLQSYDIKPCFVVPREGGLTEALFAKNIPYKVMPIPWWMTASPRSLRQKGKLIRELYQSVKIIRGLVREWQIDIIYTNTSVSPVGQLASLLERIPHIWHIREFGELDFSLRCVFPKALSYKFIESSNAVICHAKVVRDQYFKPEAKRVYLVYNGSVTKSQCDAFLEQKNLGPVHDGFVFVITSSITPKKGQETAIRAISEISKQGFKVKLLIAGDGQNAYVEQCKKLAETLNVSERVEFMGFVADPFQVYLAADCLLVCSEHEALSRAALEAMSVGLPVIGKNSGGTPEIIEDKKSGLLYNTFEELVEAMTTMVKNPGWSRQLGLEGWRVARRRFNIEDYAANVYQVMQHVARA